MCIVDALDGRGSHAAAAPEFAAPVHRDEIDSFERTSAHASGRRIGLRCPFWELNTIYMFLIFRINHCGRTAPLWRSRLHSGDSRPNERVQTCTSPNKTPQERPSFHWKSRRTVPSLWIDDDDERDNS